MRSDEFRHALVVCVAAVSFLQLISFAQEASQEMRFSRAWAEKTFADTQTPSPPGDRLRVIHEEAPGDVQKDHSSGESPIQLGEKTYACGLGVSAGTVIRVELTKPAARFTA